MTRPMIVNAVASCLCSLMLLASASAQDAAKNADSPKLDITYEQAQTLFGGKNAKMLINYRDEAGTPGGVHPSYPGQPVFLYLIDFSKNPLRVQPLDTSKNYLGGGGPISPDGTRFLFLEMWSWSYYVAPLDSNFKTNKVMVINNSSSQGSSFQSNPSWWIHPVSGDEYLIFCSPPGNNGEDISGKTYMQKMEKGTCNPSGPRLTLSTQYAFRGGRSIDGHYLFSAQPGCFMGHIEDGSAVENAKVQIVWQAAPINPSTGKIDENNGLRRRCNASISTDPLRPTWVLFQPFSHRHINYDTAENDFATDKIIFPPSGYSHTEWTQWSTHPDFITSAPSHVDDWDRPWIHDAHVFKWTNKSATPATGTWTRITYGAGAIHLWVDQSGTAQPASAPAVGSQEK